MKIQRWFRFCNKCDEELKRRHFRLSVSILAELNWQHFRQGTYAGQNSAEYREATQYLSEDYNVPLDPTSDYIEEARLLMLSPTYNDSMSSANEDLKYTCSLVYGLALENAYNEKLVCREEFWVAKLGLPWSWMQEDEDIDSK